MSTQFSYSIVSVQAPLIISKIPDNFGNQSVNIVPLYKVEFTILNDNQIKVKFGIKLTAENFSSDDLTKEESFLIVIDLIGLFNISHPVPEIKIASDFPVLANLAATVFPYARERASTLLSYSNIQYFMESLNVVGLMQAHEKDILITDLRKSVKN